MNLTLPTVSVTLGPEWATELNAALEIVDQHDHSSGKGVKIPATGLNINSHLPFNNYSLYDLKNVRLTPVTGAPLSGAANSSGISVYSGDLYYTNSSGAAIQLTSGGAVISVPAAIESFTTISITGDLIIANTDSFVYIFTDTTVARSITLPLASSVTPGRMYCIKDISGLARTNNITVNVTGGDTIDGASSLIQSSDYGLIWLVSDGSSKWSIT
jgi:hypothetical protein